jgi:isochorismate hydrolase
MPPGPPPSLAVLGGAADSIDQTSLGEDRRPSMKQDALDVPFMVELGQAARPSFMILTGLTANNCVLFTANDAYMRDYELVIPRDCVSSVTEDENWAALRQMERILKADTRPSAELNFNRMLSP